MTDKKGFLLSLLRPSPETHPLRDILSPLLRMLGQTDKKREEPAPQLPVLLRLIERRWPMSKPMLLFAYEVLLQWTDDYVTFQEGKRQGRLWGGIVGVVSGVLLTLVITGLVALFRPLPMVLFTVFALGLLLLGGGLFLLGSWLGTWLVGIVRALLGLYDLFTRKVVDNNFGISIGHDSDWTYKRLTEPQDLTDWLYCVYNQIAGLPPDEPLTFRHLEQTGKGVELCIVTSNLSHGRPYILPKDFGEFVWNEKDFQLLFPPQIIKHLKENEDKRPKVTLPEHYFFFPKREDIPVLVAVRLSVSFPLLVSAVPLYTRSSDNDTEKLQVNWFSDGGLCSNLPLQFFDQWLPTYPTLGINLTSLRRIDYSNSTQLSVLPTNQWEQVNQQQKTASQGQKPSTHIDKDLQVYLPKADDLYEPEWVGQTSLFTFLQALMATGLYHRDLSHLEMPSCRERVAQIRMKPEEAGLYLDMSPETIQNMEEKGQLAGKLLVERFNFTHYEWIRLQVLMALLDKDFEEMVNSEPDVQKYLHLLECGPENQKDFPFPQDKAWRQYTKKRLYKLLCMSQDWRDGEVHTSDPDALSITHHSPVLQVVPEF